MFGSAEFKDGEICPLLDKPCITRKCKLYKKILGTNPQTGQRIEEFDCALAMIPLLLVENAMVSRQVGAEVEKVCKESIRHRMAFLAALTSEAQQRVLNTPVAEDGPNGKPQ